MVVWWGPRAGEMPTTAWASPWAIWESGPEVGGQAWGTRSDPACPACPAEVAPRSKRRCVLERKQPYSGDEWCSGPDSEEDDKPIGATHSECPSCQGAVAHAALGGCCPKGAFLPSPRAAEG